MSDIGSWLEKYNEDLVIYERRLREYAGLVQEANRKAAEEKAANKKNSTYPAASRRAKSITSIIESRRETAFVASEVGPQFAGPTIKVNKKTSRKRRNRQRSQSWPLMDESLQFTGFVPVVAYYNLQDIQQQDGSYKTFLTVYSGNGKEKIIKNVTVDSGPDFVLKWNTPQYNYYSESEWDHGPYEAGFAVLDNDPRAPGPGYWFNNFTEAIFADTPDGWIFSSDRTIPLPEDLIPPIQDWIETGYASSRDTVKTRIASDVDSYKDIICLPVDDRCFILYYISYSNEYYCYSGYKLREYAGKSVQSIRYVPLSNNVLPGTFVSDYYDNEYDVSGAVTVPVYGRYRQKEMIDQFEERQTVFVRTEACFLVSETSVREIDVPEDLGIAFANLFPTSEDPLPEPPTATTDSFTPYSTVDIPLDISLIETQPFLMVQMEEDEPIDVLLQYERNVSDFDGLFPVIDYRLFKSYGLAIYGYAGSHFGPYWGTDAMGLGWGLKNLSFTPSIFNTFNFGNSIRFEPDTSTKYESYQNVYDDVIEGSPFSGVYIDIESSGFKYTEGIPDPKHLNSGPQNVNIALNSGSFKNNLTYDSFLENPPIGKAIVVWDWNEPSYCKTELLNLGFSSEDLVPLP